MAQEAFIRRKITKTGSTEKEIGMYDFHPSFIRKLDTFSSDIMDYLYEIEPQSQNLFWAGYFCETGDGNDGLRIFYNACYRIKSVSIPMPQLEFEHNKFFRMPVFKGPNFSQEITIEWYEDVYHSVLMYHTNWIERWYNRYYDVLRTGIKGKFRKLFVVPFHFVNSPSDFNSPIEVPRVEPLMAFEIGGLVPKTLPPLKFDYGTDANETPLSITYQCSKVYWAHNIDLIPDGLDPSAFGTGTPPPVGDGENCTSDPNSSERTDASVTTALMAKYKGWNITNITPDIGCNDDDQHERFRIARTLYSLIPGGGSLA